MIVELWYYVGLRILFEIILLGVFVTMICTISEYLLQRKLYRKKSVDFIHDFIPVFI